MPEEPDADCSTDAENATPDVPAPRPAPLQHDQADVGCLIALGGVFVCVFLLPAAAFLGGAPLLVPLVLALCLLLATPWINPAEGKAPKVKWWGRMFTFLLLVALVVAAWLVLRQYFGDRMVDDTQPG